jgi:hypothetical protein
MRYISDELLLKEVNESLSTAAREGREHDVIRDGLLLYLATRSDGSEAASSVPLVYVQSAIARIMKTLRAENSQDMLKKEEACSFCGLKSPEVRLGAGPGAYICERCVKVFSDVFSIK